MFGLQTTYKQLLSLFRDCLVGRDEKINVLKEPFAFFPPLFQIEWKLLYTISRDAVNYTRSSNERSFLGHSSGAPSPDCAIPSTPSHQNCCRHEVHSVNKNTHVHGSRIYCKGNVSRTQIWFREGGWQIARGLCLFIWSGSHYLNLSALFILVAGKQRPNYYSCTRGLLAGRCAQVCCTWKTNSDYFVFVFVSAFFPNASVLVMWARWKAKLSLRKQWGACVLYKSPWMPAGFGVITEGLPLLVKGLLTQSPVQMLIG